jgi:hypothetical protein
MAETAKSSNRVFVIVKKSALKGRVLLVMKDLIESKSSIDTDPPESIELNSIRASREVLMSTTYL